MMELQMFVASFFRRFEVKVSERMTEEDMEMRDGFSGGPRGEKLEVLLSERM
jgi:hypothetical protein